MYSCFIVVIQLAALATCKMANQNNSNIDDMEQINLDNDDNYEVNGEDKRESRMPLFLPLHSVISIPCAPIDMIKFVLSVHGNREIRMLDSQGNTPLHKAIEVVTITVNINDNINIDATTTISTTMATRNKQTVQRSQEDTKQIIQMLLKTDSNLASIQNGQGYFPFFLALQQHGTLGWDDGICFLLDAYPEVMSYNDPVFHFNPFIYSALPICVGTDNDHNSSLPNDGIEQRKRQISKLNISYQLLRKCPNLIFV